MLFLNTSKNALFSCPGFSFVVRYNKLVKKRQDAPFQLNIEKTRGGMQKWVEFSLVMIWMEWIETTPLPDNPEIGPFYDWVVGQDEETLKRILYRHKRLRIACRGAETARLG